MNNSWAGGRVGRCEPQRGLGMALPIGETSRGAGCGRLCRPQAPSLAVGSVVRCGRSPDRATSADHQVSSPDAAKQAGDLSVRPSAASETRAEHGGGPTRYFPLPSDAGA